MALLAAAQITVHTSVETYLGNICTKFESSATNTLGALGFRNIQSRKLQSGAKMTLLAAAPKTLYSFVETYLGNICPKFESFATNTLGALGF